MYNPAGQRLCRVFTKKSNNNMTHPDHPAFANDFQAGLTKREYFAAMAMQGILSGSTELSKKNAYLIAEQAILTADALIYEINKRLNPESDQL